MSLDTGELGLIGGVSFKTTLERFHYKTSFNPKGDQVLVFAVFWIVRPFFPAKGLSYMRFGIPSFITACLITYVILSKGCVT